MSDQKIAKNIDLQTHIRTGFKAAHGVWNNVLAAISGVYNALWRDNTNDDADDVYFQSGLDSVPVGSDATITFDVAFSVAPRVVATVVSSGQDANVCVHTVGTTSFKMIAYNRTSGTSPDCAWIAIGRKDR